MAGHHFQRTNRLGAMQINLGHLTKRFDGIHVETRCVFPFHFHGQPSRVIPAAGTQMLTRPNLTFTSAYTSDRKAASVTSPV